MTASKNSLLMEGTAMTLTELTALETAYHVLQPLDDTARRRALQWLSDALSQTQPLMAAAAAPATPELATAVAVAQAPVRRSTKKVKGAVHNGAARGRTGKKASANSHERTYRRMPDPAVVMKAYERIGTITGLAEHFDVPQHTATHWARRLRTQGYQIGRNG